MKLFASFMEIVIILKDRYLEDRVGDLAAQLAYYLLLSLFPFLLLAVTLMGYLPYSSRDVLEMIHPYAPPSTYDLIRSNLGIILDEKNGKILSFSLIATLYLASQVFHSIIRILNNAYHVKYERPFWKQIIVGFILMFGILFGLVITLFVSVFGDLIGKTFFTWFGATKVFLEVWSLLRWLIVSTMLFFIFLILYVLAPHTKVGFRNAFPGALAATLGWQIISYGFSLYVSSFANYTVVYGNLGALMILLGWFYLSAMILILGGMLNAAIDDVRCNRHY